MLFAAPIAVLYMVVLAMFIRRLLGVAVGLGRIIVATLFLVLAELVFPSGTLMRPDKWIGSLKARFSRTRRYTEVTRIALAHGVLPAKRPSTQATPEATAERTASGRSLRWALQESGVVFDIFRRRRDE